MDIRIAGTANDSIVDGPGIRFTIFVQGCPHNCEGCHNPTTHDFSGGRIEQTEVLIEKIRTNPLLDGVTFSGGEPFCSAKPLYEIGKEVHKLGLNIVTYTGYTYEYLTEHADSENYYRELLSVTDFLVDGPFIMSLKSYNLKFKGSSNQRIIDVKKSLEEDRIVLADI